MPTDERATENPLLPLEIQDLELNIDNRTLVKVDAMTLSHPGLTVVMGFNGAGKSLLLRLLHGLIEPTGGRITWGGNPNNAAIRLEQSMVMQRPVLLRRTVGENIDFVLKLRKIDRQKRDNILDDVGLLDRANQPARSLSGGEQQRLVLARALAVNPYVLFLDEPTASLDPSSTAAIERTIKMAGARGTKVVLVTHDIGQAKRLADEVVFVHNGKVVAHQDAAAFFDAPVSPIALAYLQGRIELPDDSRSGY